MHCYRPHLSNAEWISIPTACFALHTRKKIHRQNLGFHLALVLFTLFAVRNKTTPSVKLFRISFIVAMLPRYLFLGWNPNLIWDEWRRDYVAEKSELLPPYDIVSLRRSTQRRSKTRDSIVYIKLTSNFVFSNHGL